MRHRRALALAFTTFIGVSAVAEARPSVAFSQLESANVRVTIAGQAVRLDVSALRAAVTAQNDAVANPGLGEHQALNPRALVLDEVLAFFEHLPADAAAQLAGRTLELTAEGLRLLACDGFGVRGLSRPWRLVLGADGARIAPETDADDLRAEWAATGAAEGSRQAALRAAEQRLETTHEDDDAYPERFRARASARGALALVQSIRLGVAERMRAHGAAVGVEAATLAAEISRLEDAVSRAPAPGGMR
jgi:hypothetical protein